jgi:hypothetical protein
VAASLPSTCPVADASQIGLELDDRSFVFGPQLPRAGRVDDLVANGVASRW